MKEYLVSLTVTRMVDAVVNANSEKEAKQNAHSWSNLMEEETKNETIENVEVIECLGNLK